MQVDDVVGQVLNSVDAANLSDSTLVWVASDNGPVWRDADAERTGHDATAGFRGMKGDAYEGGHRVPTFVRFPGRVGAGERSDALTCHTDLFATIAGCLGETLPDGVAIDSVNQWSVWSQGNAPPVRTRMVIEATRRFQTIRDGHWKLIPTPGSAGFTAPSFPDPKPGQPAGQLYNLKNDPTESNNRYADEPQVVERLMRLLAETVPDRKE